MLWRCKKEKRGGGRCRQKRAGRTAQGLCLKEIQQDELKIYYNKERQDELKGTSKRRGKKQKISDIDIDIKKVDLVFPVAADSLTGNTHPTTEMRDLGSPISEYMDLTSPTKAGVPHRLTVNRLAGGRSFSSLAGVSLPV